MNDTLKVAMGAELGAAKAENEKLRGLLTTAWRLRPDQHYHEDHMQAEQKAWEVETAEVLNAADALSQQPEPTDTYTAVDMATAAAQAFRDGQAAVDPAPAQDEQHAVFWMLFDATTPEPYIKKMMPEGFLAFFDHEEDAIRAKSFHPGTDYKRVSYVRQSDHLAALTAVTAERDRLQAALSAPDTITAEPAGDYDNLRKQFQSLRMLANSNAKMVHHWRAQCGRETRETLLANAASVNAERDTNSMLTDALETAERERDRLRAEVEALRKDAERINFIEENWFYSPQWGSWSFAYREDWEKPGSTLRHAIDAAMAAKEA